MTKKMIVDLGRCIGCWTCSMACKVGKHLGDDEYLITVRTHGSGAGIDRPAGVYPDLKMGWQPIYHRGCTFCAEREEGPFCVASCPTSALAFGDDQDPESDYSKALARVKAGKYHVFVIPDYESTRSHISYATRA